MLDNVFGCIYRLFTLFCILVSLQTDNVLARLCYALNIYGNNIDLKYIIYLG